MSFRSTMTFPVRLESLDPVAEDLMSHFRGQGYEVTGQRTITGDWDVSITKTDAFKAIAGMRTALKIRIAAAGGGTTASAGIGIFGQQAIPTAITLLVFWPIAITQIWGLVEQSKLDDEAIRVVGESLNRYAGVKPADVAVMTDAEPAQAPLNADGDFCTSCGARLSEAARFCAQCGAPTTAGAAPTAAM